MPARLLAAAVLLGSGGAGLAYSQNPAKVLEAVDRTGAFEVRTLRIEGQAETSSSAIVAAIGLGPGLSLLTLDVENVRARLAALPWVQEATVRKVLPSTLEVEIVEGEAIARWRTAGGEVLVASDGRVLNDRVPFRFRHLPLVAGRGANEAVRGGLDLMAAYPQVADRVTAAVRVNGRRWDLLLDSGATLRLPEEGAFAALDRFVAIEGEGGVLTAGPVVVDLRLPDRTTVELVPSGAPVAGEGPVAEAPARPLDDDPLARAIAEAGL
jgi:cell division protein FtsQ